MIYIYKLKDTDSQSDIKQYPITFCLQEIHFKDKDSGRLTVKIWKKIFCLVFVFDSRTRKSLGIQRDIT